MPRATVAAYRQREDDLAELLANGATLAEAGKVLGLTRSGRANVFASGRQAA